MHPDLETALAVSRGLKATATNLAKVGRAVSPEAAREAFAQWELRQRAGGKFQRAAEMLFTREALEQATHERVAAYHASLFPPCAPVADLTAGIGADAIALAARGPTQAFELDPERAEMASHNLTVHGLTAEVSQADGLAWLAETEGAYVYVDPSRRVEGRRTLDPREFSPDPRLVAAHAQRQRLAVTKLSPLLPNDLLARLAPRLLFVSFQRECREVLAISGTEAEPGRYAVRVEDRQTLPEGRPGLSTPEPSRYLYDADPAAVRAHALGSLCEQFDLRPLADSNGYLTGLRLHQTPWLTAYEILYSGPGDLKRTKAELKKLGSATPELKQRAANQDLIALRRQLKAEGSRPLIVAIYAQGKSLRHIICERFP